MNEETFYNNFQRQISHSNIENWVLKKSKFQFSNFKFYNLGLGSFFAVGAVLEFEYMKRKKEVK